MTTIVFYRGFLYTDGRRVLDRPFPLHSLIEDKPFGKVHGAAIDGVPVALISSSDHDTTLSQRQAIASCLSEPPEKAAELLGAAHLISKDMPIFGHTLVVTHSNIFLIHSSSDTPLLLNGGKKPEEAEKRKVTIVDDGDWPIALGSGRNYATGYLVAGGDPRKLMEFVSRNDSVTGPDTFIYDRRELKPYPVTNATGRRSARKVSK